MKESKHLGIYGLIIEDNCILLVKKNGGPYDGKLDLPGGSMEFGERPEATLKREILEETGLEVTSFSFFDVDSVVVPWMSGEELRSMVHHVGVFYRVYSYVNEVQNFIEIDEKNNDSFGACFYEISKLHKDDVSSIVLLELEKLGYILE